MGVYGVGVGGGGWESKVFEVTEADSTVRLVGSSVCGVARSLVEPCWFYHVTQGDWLLAVSMLLLRTEVTKDMLTGWALNKSVMLFFREQPRWD